MRMRSILAIMLTALTILALSSVAAAADEPRCANTDSTQGFEQDCNGDGVVVQYLLRFPLDDKEPFEWWTTVNSAEHLPQKTGVIPADEFGPEVVFEYYTYRSCDADKGIHYQNRTAYLFRDCEAPISYERALDLL
ncbi:MAG: hypothetical protein F4X57_13650 [Chloroflexi bacterium]|nr:hypothetical protein [Chloroflexota bacterium]